ncbi:MAG TPA: class I SAM-dependent methyltransferase [Acidimicrobiales bacterium]|nr:class I SAM-dependent methyltransferase [Acidimicrobiales bacterium]
MAIARDGTPASIASNRLARQLFHGLPSRYDSLAEWLSFFQNRRWRAALVEAMSSGHPGIVLDVATGTAGVALALRERTGAGVVGVDVTEAMIRRGAAAVAGAGVTGVVLVLGRGEQLPFPDGWFDAVSFTYLLRYVEDPAATLVELARVLRPGGTLANLEFLVPGNRFWRWWWWLYTRAVLPLAGLVMGGPQWMRVGRFLGPSISRHYRRYPLDWTVAAWEAAGVADVTVRKMSLGGGLVMWGRRAGGAR